MKYILSDDFTMMREYGKIIVSGFSGSMKFAALGRWVLRGHNGSYIDIHIDPDYLINKHSLNIERIEE